jgi:hypothetical protein
MKLLMKLLRKTCVSMSITRNVQKWLNGDAFDELLKTDANAGWVCIGCRTNYRSQLRQQ